MEYIEPKFVNLTPHPINVYGSRSADQEPEHVIPSSGTIARVSTIDLGSCWIGNMPFSYIEYGRLENPPPRETGVYYIVSLVTALAVRGRDDFLAPFKEVRNTEGTMIGCRYLQKVC